MLTKVACPSCSTTNRVASGKPLDAAKCGRCGESLSLTHPAEANDQAFFKHLSATDGPVLIDVWAPWCGPCRMMAPEFEKAAETLAGEMRLLKLNADETQAAAGMNIRGIPALLMFVNGEEVARQSGAMRASDIISWARGSASAAA